MRNKCVEFAFRLVGQRTLTRLSCLCSLPLKFAALLSDEESTAEQSNAHPKHSDGKGGCMVVCHFNATTGICTCLHNYFCSPPARPKRR
eukprot:3147357-Amphidinium_carterae.1